MGPLGIAQKPSSQGSKPAAPKDYRLPPLVDSLGFRV